MQHRLAWIDIAKGVGIVLVVVGHAGRGLTSAAIPDEIGLLPVMDKAIYAFHMPFFFILSGVTFGIRPIVDLNPDLPKRLWRLFYPLVLWSYVFLAMRALAGESANTAGSWENVLVLPLPPVAHFWFLWALLLNVALFAILRIVLRHFLKEWSFWVLAICISSLTSVFTVLPDAFVPFFGNAVIYSVAFAIGGLIGSSTLRETTPSRIVAFFASALFIFIILAILVLPKIPLEVFIGNLLSLILLVPILSLAAWSIGSRLAQIVAFLGTISLALYVMHTAFSAASRIILLKFGIENLAIHLILGVSAGVICPIFIYIVARRFLLLKALGLA